MMEGVQTQGYTNTVIGDKNSVFSALNSIHIIINILYQRESLGLSCNLSIIKHSHTNPTDLAEYVLFFFFSVLEHIQFDGRSQETVFNFFFRFFMSCMSLVLISNTKPNRHTKLTDLI